jgi:hypothetical protein
MWIILLLLLSEPPAYVRVVTLVPEFWIVFEEDFRNARFVKSMDVIAVSPGIRTIRVFHPSYRDWTGFLLSPSNDTTDLAFSMVPVWTDATGSNSSYLRYQTGGNVLVNTDDDTAVIRGRDTLRIGSGYVQLADGRVNRIQLHSKHGFTQMEQVDLTSKRVVTIDAYVLPDRQTSIYWGLFPGGSAYYKRQYLKSAVLGISGFAALGLTYAGIKDVEDRIAAYDQSVLQYERALNMSTAIRYREEARKNKSLADQAINRRNIFMGVSAGILLVNVIDSFRPPKSGFRDDSNRIEFVTNPGGVGVRVNFR